MAGLAYIRKELEQWDTKKYRDYKVRNLVFTCPSEKFTQWKKFTVTAWKAEDTVYGIANSKKQVRISALKAAIAGATIYRASKKQRQQLLEMGDKQIETQSDKELTQQCYREYVESLGK